MLGILGNSFEHFGNKGQYHIFIDTVLCRAELSNWDFAVLGTGILRNTLAVVGAVDIAYPTEAIIVFHIFERFADGDSLGKIAASLARMKVKSPTGKELWTRETISKILSNEKYVGDVILGKTQVQNGVQVKMVDHTSQTVINGHHEAIISRELFDIVQQEKAHRSRLKSHSHVV